MPSCRPGFSRGACACCGVWTQRGWLTGRQHVVLWPCQIAPNAGRLGCRTVLCGAASYASAGGLQVALPWPQRSATGRLDAACTHRRQASHLGQRLQLCFRLLARVTCVCVCGQPHKLC